MFSSETKIAEITAQIKNKVELGRFMSLVFINSRGTIMTPNTQLKEIQAEYDWLIFLRYLDMNALGGEQ